MLSAGGFMTGKLWTDMPRNSSEMLENDHLRMSLQLRLGIVEVPAGTLCQMPKANSDEGCLHDVATPWVHPHVCKCGPARLRPHRAVMVALKRTLEKAGVEADLERSGPMVK